MCITLSTKSKITNKTDEIKILEISEIIFTSPQTINNITYWNVKIYNINSIQILNGKAQEFSVQQITKALQRDNYVNLSQIGDEIVFEIKTII